LLPAKPGETRSSRAFFGIVGCTISDEAFSEAEALLAHAIWILAALLEPEQWRDPQSDAHRWLPLDSEGHAWMERLVSHKSNSREVLEWFAGPAAAADRQLLEAWTQILGQAKELMVDRADLVLRTGSS
jgi:hypothetical protein